jgi:hypothetical protein
MSSNPWPSNWASQERDSVRPKKRYGTFNLYSVCLPVCGRLMGQFALDPLMLFWEDWTSSGIEMSRTFWPPVWEPLIPSRP